MEQTSSVQPPQSLPSSDEPPSKMISPPNSVSGDSTASSDGFDRTVGISAESSRLTSYSSVQTVDAKPVEENGQAMEPAAEKVAPEEQSRIEGGTTPVPVGTQSRVRQEVVSAGTLKNYHIDHFIDVDPEYVVITRPVPDYEMDFLKRHTEELKKAVDQTSNSKGPSSTALLGNSPAAPAPPHHPQGSVANAEVQTPAYFSTTGYAAQPERALYYGSGPPPGPPPGPPRPLFPIVMPSSIDSEVKDADLILEINRVPFGEWLDAPEDEKKQTKNVLDVAMQRKESLQPKSYEKRSIAELLTDSVTSNPDGDPEVPVRLRINSELLRVQLEKITEFDFDDDSNVLHPPWKVLVNYEEDIRKRLGELEKKAAEGPDETVLKKEEDLVQTPTEKENDQNQKKSKPDVSSRERNDSRSRTCEFCWGLEHTTCLKDTVNHLKCLVSFIDNDLKHVFELRRGLQECTVREVAFEDLWHLYAPGDLIVTSGLVTQRQAYKIFYTSGGRPTVRKNGDSDDGPRSGPKRGPKYDDGPRSKGWKSATFEKIPTTTPFTIHCYYIDFDKKWLGPAHQIITIPRYEGKRPVTGLTMSYSDSTSRHPASAFPIRFLEQPEAAIADLVRRGKRHRELTPFSHKKYTGPSSVADPEYLNSEIIIDFEQQDLNLDSIGRFDELWVNGDEVPEGCTLHEPCYDCDDIFNDNIVDKERAVRNKQDQHLFHKRDAGDQNLTDEHYMLMCAEVNAFVLRERCVFGVYVDLVQDLDGDHGESLKELKKVSGFEDLVLPEGHGDLVEALVRTHRSTRKPRDEEAKVQVDLIDGKGEGLVILLHGVPGVGKTSTAECVAAYTRRPLYPITCANIGLDPEEVEEKLTGANGHFRRAQQWNCVVLLDEADVFLARREARDNDSKRNALVSVFLRILEYYPGILILTTNRVGAFDEAVVSRIQLFLYYPPLDEEKTLRVWGVHIARVRASGLINIDYEDEAMIMDFAKQEYTEGRRWNGRQIRNFFQTAISLASYDATKWRQKSIEDGRAAENSKPRLTTRTLRIVAETSGKFIDYINATVPDGSHQKQQLDDGNRNDSWEETPKKGMKKR